MKTVGIIGGLGPETTSEFYLDLVFSCAKKDKTARPAIVIASVPLPYQIEEDLILKSEGMERYIPYLTAEAQRLEKAGADFIVMPCNSLHVFIEQIRKSVSIPVLSIVEETVKFLKKESMSKVGIVSTSATIKNKLTHSCLLKFVWNDILNSVFGKSIFVQFIFNRCRSRNNSDFTHTFFFQKLNSFFNNA
ncbi:MAG: amino acid racemase [bacterium]|nr:amino acid racemase [bacterium]